MIFVAGMEQAILASGKFYVLRKIIYAMIYRFTVTICVSMAVVGGKLRFLSGRPRDIWHCIFHRSFRYLGADYCNFSTIATISGVWEGFLLTGGEFPLF